MNETDATTGIALRDTGKLQRLFGFYRLRATRQASAATPMKRPPHSDEQHAEDDSKSFE